MLPPLPLRLTLGLLVLGGTPAGLAAAPPQLTSLSQRGLQSGKTTTLVLTGDNLGPAPRVLVTAAGVVPTVRPGATAGRVEVELKVAPGVVPGYHLVRLATDEGVSNALPVAIEDLPQAPFTAQCPPLPVALSGNLSGSEAARATFPGRKGQRFVAEVEARRFGSALDPVLNLYDPDGKQLAWAKGKPSLGGDARVEAVLPADGTYTVELQDLVYQPAAASAFRLKLGDLQYVDLVYPLGVQQGRPAVLELLGSVSGIRRVAVDGLMRADDVQAPLALVPGLTGPLPRLRVGEYPEFLEEEVVPGKLQEVKAPGVVNGRLARPGEEDRYRILVQPGMRLRLDLLAHRAGSPLDGVLTLAQESGPVVAESDDRADTVDPGMDYTVPAGVTSLVATVRDLQARGGRDYVYRLSLAPQVAPDFRLALLQDRHQLPRQGSAALRVRATRSGYPGPIRLAVHGLPPGVTVSGDTIPAGATDALLSLTAPEGQALSAGLVQVVGSAPNPERGLQRPALVAETPATRVQPWLRRDLALAVTPAAPLDVVWEKPEGTLPLGGNLTARVKVTRRRPADANNPVRLALLTSQVVPMTPAAPGQPPREDATKAIRFEGTPRVAGGTAEGSAKILVPADLPALPYDLVIRAELLSPDGQRVLAAAETVAQRASAVKPPNPPPAPAKPK